MTLVARKCHVADFPLPETLPPYRDSLPPYNVRDVARLHRRDVLVVESPYSQGLPPPPDDCGRESPVDRAVRLRGEAYYRFTTTHERSILSILPNLRDLASFADVPGFGTGQVFRSGSPVSHDPQQLIHVLKTVLRVRTVLDLRGSTSLATRGDTADSVTLQALVNIYIPYVYVPSLDAWTALGNTSASDADAMYVFAATDGGDVPFWDTTARAPEDRLSRMLTAGSAVSLGAGCTPMDQEHRSLLLFSARCCMSGSRSSSVRGMTTLMRLPLFRCYSCPCLAPRMRRS